MIIHYQKQYLSGDWKDLTFDVELDLVGACVRVFRTDLAVVGRFVSRIHIVNDQAPFVCSLVIVDTDSLVRHKCKHPNRKGV